MRFRRVTGIIAILLMLMTGALAAPVAAATTYADPQQRFSFTIPDGYTPTPQVTPPVVAGFVAASPAGANFTIQVRDATGSLDDATTEFQKRYASGTDSQPGPNGVQSLTLGGLPAKQFDYFTSAQGTRFHISQVVAVNGKALYILIFTAQEGDYDTLVNQTGVALSSFAFLAAGSAPISSQTSDGTAMYSDPQGRFSFAVPIDFQQSTGAGASKVSVEFESRSLSGNVSSYFFVDVQDAPTDTTISLSRLATFARNDWIDKKYSILSEQTVSLGGQPAYRFDVTKTLDSGANVRTVDINASNGSKVFQVTFTCSSSRFDEFAARFQGVLSSFSFSATPNPVTPPTTPPPAAPTKPAPSVPAAPPPANPPPSAPPPSSPAPTDGHDNGR